MIKNPILNGYLREFKDEYSFSRAKESDLFEHFVNYLVVSKIYPEAFIDKDAFSQIKVDEGSTFGIDCIALFINNVLIRTEEDVDSFKKQKGLEVKIIIIQSKASEALEVADLSKLALAATDFLNENTIINSNSALKHSRELLRHIYESSIASRFKDLPTCDLFFCNAGILSPSELFENAITVETEKLTKAFQNTVSNFKINYINSKNLISRYRDCQNSSAVIVNLEKVIPCAEISNVIQAFIGYISGSEYLKIITDNEGDLRHNLFYENVRDYQGINNSVNLEISETLTSENLLDSFVLLNNGVTVVVNNLARLPGTKYEISNYHIVNGCQTSNVFYRFHAQIKNLDSVFIPIKIVHTTSSETISRIIRSTNRQTPVPDEAFITLEQFHKDLQDFFHHYSVECGQTILYERRSKEYIGQNLERSRIIGLHALIKNFAAIMLNQPYLPLTRNPNSILKDNNSIIFSDSHGYIQYFMSCFLVHVFHENINNGKLDGKYEISKYWICWLVRILIIKNISANLSRTSNNDDIFRKIIIELQNPEKQAEYFLSASVMLDAAKEEYEEIENQRKTYGELVRSKIFCQYLNEYIGKRKFL